MEDLYTYFEYIDTFSDSILVLHILSTQYYLLCSQELTDAFFLQSSKYQSTCHQTYIPDVLKTVLIPNCALKHPLAICHLNNPGCSFVLLELTQYFGYITAVRYPNRVLGLHGLY